MFGMMIDIYPKFYTVQSPPIHDLKVKVMEFLYLCFPLKFLGLNPVIWLMFVMIVTGPKFNAVPSPLPYMTLRSRSQTKNFYLKFYAKVLKISFFPNPVIDLIDIWYDD